MHPDLSPHLHTEECNILISKLKDCHTNNKISKFFGACSEADRELLRCLKKEVTEEDPITISTRDAHYVSSSPYSSEILSSPVL
ncbi:COX assembly mitochondrial protein 2 homolog isoform X3 [Rhodnius prolixus]|uniref:COX assembly mitochondrial protein 2 homolog isoform X3 n=1 Tax=Rhodnius prolixus TaxID=13249 RepID=UPI003D18A7E3